MLILGISLTFACVCTNDIKTGFENASNYVVSILNQATNQINAELIPHIERNTYDILQQNEELEILLNSYKLEVLQKKEILYLLEQSNKLLK